MDTAIWISSITEVQTNCTRPGYMIVEGCLFPQADGNDENILNDPAEREMRIFERPLSGIKIDGQKIKYFKFISSLENKDCNEALRKIVPKIDMDKINRYC